LLDLGTLNPRQRQAVLHGDGPLLILAGAGTGKTRTLTWRIAHLIERGVPADRILAVAFTNKAASELRERVARLIGLKGPALPPVSTFHSFCLGILRRDIGRLGWKENFSIYDTADQLSAVRDAVKEKKLAGRDLDVKRIQAIISRAKNDGGKPDPGDGSDEYSFFAYALFDTYASILRAYNAVDFDDLLLMSLRLLTEHEDVRDYWRERCRHILVDEFQDTNSVQYRIVSLLAEKSGNLTVVGDDDQSIYGWRGALPGNILGFTRDWPSATVVTLDQNYRSTGRILAAANAVISGNASRRPKNLWSDLGEGEPVEVIACRNGDDEAAAVAERMAGLITRGVKPGDCAVIFRTNVQSRPFEDALRRAGLRYVLVGGTKFYDRREVRDFLAYLMVVQNPRNEVALLRIINYPHRGIGRETVVRLHEESIRRKAPMIEVLRGAASVPGMTERQVRAVDAFLTLLSDAERYFGPGRLATGAAALLKDIGLEEELRGSGKDAEAAARRVENVREVITSIESFERESPGAALAGYLGGITLSGREEESDDGLSDRTVTLLTVHAAKGLEFPYVFFTGLEEGLLPHRRSVDEQGGLGEERRLVYVGMTRARKALVMSWAAERLRRDKLVPSAPSRFLDELPEAATKRTDRRREHLDPEEEARTAADFFAWARNL
jgi:superfamily I DNA/RNA helicase